MQFNVLMSMHPMIGVDLHDGIPPPGPVPVPKIPHFTAAMLRWAVPTSLPTTTVFGPFGPSMMGKGSDIGNFIPHLAHDYLVPLLTATSGSKSHFGASQVVANGNPVAAAIAIVVNFNLNCAGAVMPPLPSGFVVAPNTVVVGLTLGDVLAGLLSGIVDSLIQFALNRMFDSKVAGQVFSRLQGPIVRALIPNAGRWVSLTTALFGQSNRVLRSPWVAHTLAGAIPAAVGVLLGSPLGYTPPREVRPIGGVGHWAEDTSNWAGSYGQTLGNSAGELLDDPSTPLFPSSSPAVP